MSLFGNGILGSLFGYGDPSGMANSYNQYCGFGQQQAGQQAYHDHLRRCMEQQQQYRPEQTATPKPASDDNIIDAEFTVMEIDGRKLLDSDKKS